MAITNMTKIFDWEVKLQNKENYVVSDINHKELLNGKLCWI